MSKANEDPEESEKRGPLAQRVFKAKRQDPDMMLRDVHRALLGDEFGNEGLVVAVNKNTKFRHVREEERRVQMKFAKIGGFITGGGATLWLTMKEKILIIYNAFTQ